MQEVVDGRRPGLQYRLLDLSTGHEHPIVYDFPLFAHPSCEPHVCASASLSLNALLHNLSLSCPPHTEFALSNLKSSLIDIIFSMYS